ncbi:MAG: prepilin peptidase [Niameybacter sp.]|uniref:prepilin peptidase n=1 Tax=Niameybacter sp. TaxID=2033640 RepID=UPI002FC67F16
MELLLWIFILSVGLIIGSFLNVCIYRIPNGESINDPPSHCQHCAHRLGVLDLVPVVSYLCLGGKCRYCGEKISPQYACIELINGLGWVYSFYHFGLSVEAVLACVFISVVIVLTVIDWRHMILPTGIIVFGSVVALLGKGLLSYIHQDFSILLKSLLGGAVGYGIVALIFYIAIWALKKEGMGYGDVRYLGMIGLFTSPSLVFLTLLIGSVVGSVYGLILLKKQGESMEFPFGPFLTIGALISLFYGDQLINWYLALWM